MDLSDEFLSTGYEPNAYDFKETSVEPYTELLDSPPFFSDIGFPADVEYDDAKSENSTLVCYACVVTLHDYTTDANDDMTT